MSETRHNISIGNIRNLCAERKIKWTAHALMRIQERGIQPSDVVNCINSGKIIEQYADDYPYPSCLVLGYAVKDRWLHTVIGLGEGFIWLITAYWPNPDEWDSTFEKREEVAK